MMTDANDAAAAAAAPAYSSSDAASEEGDTFDESASSLTFLVGEKNPSSWIHPGPHTPTRLQFADCAEVRITTGLHEYTPEEIYSCWMNDLDEANAQAEIVDTVRHMRKPPKGFWKWLSSQQGADNNTDDSSDAKTKLEQREEDFTRYLEEEFSLSTRGIEHMKTKAAREQRQLRRKFIAQVVLEEQEHQRRLEMHNSEAIAENANILSRKSTEKATEVAAVDKQYADLRRASLPAQYAKTIAKELFFAQSSRKMSIGLYSLDSTSDDDDDDDDEDKNLTHRRRSSSISYEKHDGVVMEEICRIVEDDDDRETRKETPSAKEGTAKCILARMRDDIIRTKEEEGVVEKEEPSPPTKEEITGITDSLHNTHLPRRNDAPKRNLVSTRKQASFRRIGQKPAAKTFLDSWGDYQYNTATSMCSGQQHMRRLMNSRTKKA